MRLALMIQDPRFPCYLERELKACFVAFLEACSRRVLLELLVLVGVLVEMDFNPSLALDVGLNCVLV